MLKKWLVGGLTLLWACGIGRADAVFPPTWGAAQVFVQPEAGRYPYLTMIMNADKTLDIAAYHLSDPEIVRALKGAIQRGVRVRILLGAHTKKSVDPHIEALKEIGAQVYAPSKRFHHSHYKMIIADGKWGLISTGNLDKESFDGNAQDHPARDFAMPIGEEPLVREMARIFTADIHDQRVVPKETPLVWGPEQTRNIHLGLINLAHKSIWMYNQDIQDNGMIRALEGAARAGVDVRVLMTPNPSHAPKDPNTTKQRRLVAAGAQVRLLSDPYIHAKVMMVDGKEAYVGSANLWHTSLDGARELGIIASEPKQLKILHKTFEEDWSKAKEVEGSKPSKKEPYKLIE